MLEKFVYLLAVLCTAVSAFIVGHAWALGNMLTVINIGSAGIVFLFVALGWAISK